MPRLEFSLDDVEYHFLYSVIMQTSQLITTANVQTTKYRERLAAIKERLPVPTTMESETNAPIKANILPPEAISMLVEANIDVIALSCESKRGPLVKFFMTGFPRLLL